MKKNAAAVALGRKGGKARAKKLSKKRMREIAMLGVEARWKKSRARPDGPYALSSKPALIATRSARKKGGA